MSLRSAVRWGMRPKRVGILIAKLILAGGTPLAAQTNSYPGMWSEISMAPIHVQTQRSVQGPVKFGRHGAYGTRDSRDAGASDLIR